MDVDLERIWEFWQDRAALAGTVPVEVLTHFESDRTAMSKKLEVERAAFVKAVRIRKDGTLLDMGAGTGLWSLFFAPRCRHVTAVDYCGSLLEIGMAEAERRGITNIDFVESSAQEFYSDSAYDVVFVSGLIQYLNDSDLQKLLERCTSYSRIGTQLLLREPIGVGHRLVLNEKPSKNLGTTYSSVYRTRDELVGILKAFGFDLQYDEWLYADDSGLNKWNNSRIRLFDFKKI